VLLLLASLALADEPEPTWPQPLTVRATGWYAAADQKEGFGAGVAGEGWFDQAFGLGLRVGSERIGSANDGRRRVLTEATGLVGIGDLHSTPVGTRALLGLGAGLASISPDDQLDCPLANCSQNEPYLTSNLTIAAGVLTGVGPVVVSGIVRFETIGGDRPGGGSVTTAEIGIGGRFSGPSRSTPRPARATRPETGVARTPWLETPASGDEVGVPGYPMVAISPSTFPMGSGEERYSVSIGHRYAIGTTEVSQSLYKSLMGDNPSYFKSQWRPVERVTWFDAVLFCNALSVRNGLEPAYDVRKVHDDTIVKHVDGARGFRLPTEGEWALAARLGDPELPFAGSTEASYVAWYLPTSGDRTHKVGTKAPTEAGIADLSGNVAEWVWDWFDELPTSDVVDPVGPRVGDRRAVRGGSWRSPRSDVEVSSRRGLSPTHRGPDIGFRVVRPLPPLPPQK
jgi:formylglycine-generating enzyme required for sulfatase activity